MIGTLVGGDSDGLEIIRVLNSKDAKSTLYQYRYKPSALFKNVGTDVDRVWQPIEAGSWSVVALSEAESAMATASIWNALMAIAASSGLLSADEYGAHISKRSLINYAAAKLSLAMDVYDVKRRGGFTM